MSQVANILVASNVNSELTTPPGVVVYTDSATVASNKTYSPDGLVSPGVWQWVDRAGGIQVGYPLYRFSGLRPQKGNRNLRIREMITLPVMNITSPSTGSGIQPLPSVAYTLYCNVEWVIPEAALLADRMVLWSRAASLRADAVYASDGSPTSVVASPIRQAVLTGEFPFG